MEATKNITAKEREFIAAVEAHRNAEGKVIAWDICANGNGKVIFENVTKNRYSCAHVIDMEGGYFLLFVGERAGHPYDHKTYKRKGNALKGFKMQEGHNEPPTFAATPAETPQISTETAETANVSAEGENAAERAENKPKAERMKSKDDITEQLERIRVTFLSLPDWDLEPRVGRMVLAEDICKRYLENINQHLGLYDETEFCRYSDLKIPQLVYAAPQSPETPQMGECTAEQPEPRGKARKRQNRAIGSAQHHQHSALGANGYTMLDDASATMAAMNARHNTLRDTLRPVAHVPRECSTAEAAYW